MKKRPIELLEESLQILRSGGVSILAFYWTGSLPFAVALLWMVLDTGFSWGNSLLLRDSLVCAAAFLWMSYWKSLASKRILALLSADAGSHVNWIVRLGLQSVFQTLKLFVMPLAIASILGWPAASLFFRTLAREPVELARPITGGLQRAFSVASDGYKQSVVAFLTFSALAVVTSLNLVVAFALLPQLWKVFTGYETDWSRMQNGIAFASLFGVAAVATWFLLDPWMHAYAMLRVFYSSARSDGRDLLRDLSRLAAMLLLCFCLTAPLLRAEASNHSEQALNQAIERASHDSDYSWLHPPPKDGPQGFLGNLADEISNGYIAARDKVVSWYRSFVNWLDDHFGGDNSADNGKSKSAKPRSQELRLLLVVLCVMICGLVVALFLRTGKLRRAKALAAAASPAPVADVLNEQLLPSDVSQEEWLILAAQYLAEGQTRLAARAFYLANLSYLGAQNVLSLALWKSNRIYERELARIPQSSGLSPAFVTGNRLYERAWYGMRELAPEQMDAIKGAVETLRAAHA